MLKRLFKNVLYCVICVALAFGILCFIFQKVNSKTGFVPDTEYSVKLKDNNNKNNSTKVSSLNEQSVSSESGNNINENENKNKKCLEIYNKNKKYLILANRDNPLPEDYIPSLKYICNERLEASEYLYDSLVQMLEDAKAKGYSYWIASAYRSYDKQQSLVDEDVNTFMYNGMSYETALEEVYKETMPAGCSEHQTGLALDILCTGNNNMDISQEEEPGNKWLRANCYKYGFILRYPEDKSSITGISFEPWHFRYVGREAAKYIMKNNITLEEFYEKLGDIKA